MSIDGVIKGVKAQIDTLQAEIEITKNKISQLQREQTTKTKQIAVLKQKLKSTSEKTTLTLSDHAIVRYLERVKGIDIEAAKSEILNEDVIKMVKTLGGKGKFPIGSHQLVINNYTISTIL